KTSMNTNFTSIRFNAILNKVIILLFTCNGLCSTYASGGNTHHFLINSAPVFSSNNYNFSVSEEAALNTTVSTVTATDADGDAIAYSIRSGNTNSSLAINSVTGAIRIVKRLNHHTQDSYTLIVRATDGGGLFDEANVMITVQAGTSIPSFTTIYWGTVANSPYGTHEVHGDA